MMGKTRRHEGAQFSKLLPDELLFTKERPSSGPEFMLLNQRLLHWVNAKENPPSKSGFSVSPVVNSLESYNDRLNTEKIRKYLVLYCFKHEFSNFISVKTSQWYLQFVGMLKLKSKYSANYLVNWSREALLYRINIDFGNSSWFWVIATGFDRLCPSLG